ncbi:DUF2470 domain-containing protein [Virgisporangium ochraceum]|uniref:DUF2470 domain-containing protein n=1 Tax=Virgisporangium ochraceum TaxID=65505 RepID=A0A8J4E8S5_9ACTN|nr:DUF2470 domain-containing protein [Virgisporangium ochraceum]GIJ65548.1 hypothetical protein Voc01_004650 [Virgisporangium ochraceum]
MNEPSPAERLRSLLCSASSLDIVAAGRRVSLLDGHAVDADGRLTIEVPADSALALELAEGPLPAIVEITDVSPVAMRNRIRARATFAGGLRSTTGTTTHFDLAAADLTERGVTTHVSPAEFVAAAPDLLATREAALLCHLVDAHADLVSWLSRLVPVERLHGVTRVHPLHLDRFGIVLRLEFPSRDRDVRLPFGQPVRTVEDAPSRMLELLARARTCRRRVA